VQPTAAHTSPWTTGEVVFGIPFLLGAVMQLAIPRVVPRESLPWLLIPVGALLFVAGGALIQLARRELRRLGQPTDPGHPTTRIVTTGVFSISRNPMYVGAAFLLAGIALVIGLPWSLVLLLPSLAACHYLLIRHEERYLAAKFPCEYCRYSANVHRWFGRSRTETGAEP
jgi:protein-S-isoprenylcysteine O-methyltransferase Ste14